MKPASTDDEHRRQGRIRGGRVGGVMTAICRFYETEPGTLRYHRAIAYYRMEPVCDLTFDYGLLTEGVDRGDKE